MTWKGGDELARRADMAGATVRGLDGEVTEGPISN